VSILNVVVLGARPRIREFDEFPFVMAHGVLIHWQVIAAFF
jgi:hypothetical protein